jgi:hypothetical protein
MSGGDGMNSSNQVPSIKRMGTCGYVLSCQTLNVIPALVVSWIYD